MRADSGQRLVIDPGVFHEFKQKQEASVKLQEAVKALASHVKRMQQDLGKEYGVKVQ